MTAHWKCDNFPGTTVEGENSLNPHGHECSCNCYSCLGKSKVGYETLLLTAVLWPPVTQTLENTMREHFGKHFGKHSGTSWFGVTLLRQLSLQLLFLPREKQGRIRNFASNCGPVASSSPNPRKHNARALPRALRDLLLWGHPSSTTVAAIAMLA